jgi:hypothetical protein
MYDLSLHGGQRGPRQKYFKLWSRYFEMMYQELAKLPKYKNASSCHNSELIVSKFVFFIYQSGNFVLSLISHYDTLVRHPREILTIGYFQEDGDGDGDGESPASSASEGLVRDPPMPVFVS